MDILMEALARLRLDDEVMAKTSLAILKHIKLLKGRPPPDSTLFDFEGKIDRVVQHFINAGLNRDAYVDAALRFPQLFVASPERVINSIQKVVEHFASDLSPELYLGAALRLPSLFCSNPATVIGNIDGVLDFFREQSLTRSAYLRSAIKVPSLFAQSPRTITANITDLVERFSPDLTVPEYLLAATSLPSLFGQKPDTVAGHIHLVAGLEEAGLLGLPETPRAPPGTIPRVLKFLMSNPAFLALADDNFALREIYARVVPAPPSAKLLRIGRKEVERELSKALGHDKLGDPLPKLQPEDGAEHHARNLLLRSLIREGWIKGRVL